MGAKLTKVVRYVAVALPMAFTVSARADAVADAVAAGVPSALVKEVAARASEHGMPVADALAPVTAGVRRGIPPELIGAKVIEGLAKGVPPPRVASVASTLADRLAAAGAFLDRARVAGLTEPSDRSASLVDLGHAMSAGVTAEAIEALTEAARQNRGSSDAVVEAARALGELAHRGVSLNETLPVGRAMAKRGGSASEVVAQFDAFRAEGGKDPKLFLNEAARRLEAKHSLDGIVDHFGDSKDRVLREHQASKRADDLSEEEMKGISQQSGKKGSAPLDHPNAGRGAVPGVDDVIKGQGRDKGRGPKK
jgi:hypothetical protein